MPLFPSFRADARPGLRPARRLPAILLLAGTWLLLAGHAAPAAAAPGHDACTGFIDTLPAQIDSAGTWCLRKDLSTALTSGTAIHVRANNVIIDCNGYRIGGLAAGPATEAWGIWANGDYATIRNCGIRGFGTGIYLDGQNGDLSGNRLDNNLQTGIEIRGPAALVRNNQVLGTGGSTVSRHVQGILISGAHGVIVDNIIDTLIPSPVEDLGPTVLMGIDTSYFSGATVIERNVIRNFLVPPGTSSNAIIGIWVVEIDTSRPTRISIRDNQITLGQADRHGDGILCSLYADGSSAPGGASVRGNLVQGFATGIENCHNDGRNNIR